VPAGHPITAHHSSSLQIRACRIELKLELEISPQKIGAATGVTGSKETFSTSPQKGVCAATSRRAPQIVQGCFLNV